MICDLNDGRSVIYKVNTINLFHPIIIKYLCLIDTLNQTSNNIRVPDSLNINDIIQCGNTILYCGNISGRATCGFVPLSEFTSNSSTAWFYYYQIPTYQNTTIFTDLLKIKYFNTNSSFPTHYVMIGECTSSSKVPNRCVVDLHSWSNSSFIINYNFAFIKGGNTTDWFNDIEVTDNYVFAVGQNIGSGDIFVQRFPKPTNGTNSIFSSGNYQNQLFLTNIDPDYNSVTCRLAHVENDSIAVAYIGQTNTKYGLSIDYIDGAILTTLHEFQLFYISGTANTPWKIIDFDLDKNGLGYGNYFYAIVDTGSTDNVFISFEQNSPFNGFSTSKPSLFFNAMDGHLCAANFGHATLLNGLQLLLPDKCFRWTYLYPFNYEFYNKPFERTLPYHSVTPILTYLSTTKTTSSITNEKCY